MSQIDSYMRKMIMNPTLIKHIISWNIMAMIYLN